ncbi:ATP-binding protein, partial [uncultured Oscillibacter sp.]|uniref:ATP-binding protein n=1 Tax=uncultured Oscillibacter sp. TaxID=876091 RepID=UPI0035A5D2D0
AADAAPPAPPSRSREAITAQLEEVRSRRAAACSAADRLAGQLHAGGDPVVLRSAADHLSRQIGGLEAEYGAIQLAMEALDQANTALQNRFSPALGRRAAQIFRELTEGRYGGVVLDRSLHLSAEPSGDGVYRDAGLLSAGTADQLYLAARLAICDLVLPEEAAVPLVLDDALANFDDRRCAAALRWLKEAAGRRQILLFTCHSREAAFFAEDGEVSIRQLTDAAELV